MATRQDFIKAVEGWLETPFHHQGRLKGVGVDCIGLVVKAAEEVGVILPDETDYKRFEQGDALADKIAAHTKQAVDLEDIEVGDLLHYRWICETTPERTNHVAIYIGDGLIVHADGSRHVKRVVKARVEFTPAATVVGVYRLDLED